ECSGALEDVPAVEDRADDRGVRRRAADPELLERADERRLGVARRRARLVPLRLELRELRSVALGDVREAALLVVVRPRAIVVAALLVGREEAAERDHRATRGELHSFCGRGLAADPQ